MTKELYGVVAIDGKQARRTKDAKKRPLHVVSAFSAKCRLVLSQLACEEKGNEITAIPKLLEILEIKGCIVMIDAMGTQTNIAKSIIDTEADYILALKENQKTLYNEVKLYLDDIRKEKKLLESDNYHKTVDKGHSRFEIRECIISEEISWIESKSDWKNLNGVGAIYCTIEKNGETSQQSHYFIYSGCGLNAEQIMKYKRSHWSIENNLHWVLDMAFRKDRSRARKDNSAGNFNVIRQIAFNILKSYTSFKGGITDKQFSVFLILFTLIQLSLTGFVHSFFTHSKTLELRQVLKFVKNSLSKKRLNELVHEDETYRHISRKTANMLNIVTGSNLKYDNREETVDMCLVQLKK